MKKKNKKIKKIKEKSKKKSNTQKILALTLALIAVALLIINAIYILMYREKIISEILNSKEFQGSETEVLNMVPVILGILIMAWFILALLFSLAIYFVEKEKWKWHSLLVMSFVLLVFFRIDSFVLGIISSLLYKK